MKVGNPWQFDLLLSHIRARDAIQFFSHPTPQKGADGVGVVGWMLKHHDADVGVCPTTRLLGTSYHYVRLCINFAFEKIGSKHGIWETKDSPACPVKRISLEELFCAPSHVSTESLRRLLPCDPSAIGAERFFDEGPLDVYPDVLPPSMRKGKAKAPASSDPLDCIFTGKGQRKSEEQRLARLFAKLRVKYSGGDGGGPVGGSKRAPKAKAKEQDCFAKG